METEAGADPIGSVDRDFVLEAVDSIECLHEVFRLRYQVYCRERQFEPDRAGLETDVFDALSRHVLLRHRATGQAIGVARLIIPRLAPSARLPIEQVVNPSSLRALPRSCVAEVSRFALSKEWRAANGTSNCLARLALVRGLVQLSARMRLTHWYALMEPKLLRLLGSSGIHFFPLGGLVQYHGLRQPCILGVTEMLERMRREKPAEWDFITRGGALWRAELNGDAA